ncbi:MAG: ATP-binding protein [bacterium]
MVSLIMSLKEKIIIFESVLIFLISISFITSIWGNLMANAEDSIEEKMKIDSSHGFSTIIVRTFTQTNSAGFSVIIEIHGYGIGIPQEMLPKVFDPFFTTKEPDKGTGL